jgi:hypothetical protein
MRRLKFVFLATLLSFMGPALWGAAAFGGRLQLQRSVVALKSRCFTGLKTLHSSKNDVLQESKIAPIVEKVERVANNYLHDASLFLPIVIGTLTGLSVLLSKNGITFIDKSILQKFPLTPLIASLLLSLSLHLNPNVMKSSVGKLEEPIDVKHFFTRIFGSIVSVGSGLSLGNFHLEQIISFFLL